ncbi:DnaJ C-terminal domain-containing protein [Allopontixanthobacter sediminis]|uniref:DnaJ domain-containing protein n=1 Tax=Allopontixanthobacter sediminis TaxID=1689985 RepID=A0A845B9W8_9SPHN|nr:DnaJ C-terminal domain-containing protein [Allopontixanthobacter sediminis]MXP44389.1 DnaJ domain-containing protein [Allopontixanthobacter sediminis]
MADPYTTLGIPRSATDKDIKSAYRKLAKELHPDRNKDNPNATERFSAATQAYDLLSDKDQRARFDRGEIDAEGNPTSPFGGGGFGGGSRFRDGGFGTRPGGPGGQGGFRPEDMGGFAQEGVDLGDIFEGLFGGRTGMGAGGGPAGMGTRRPPPPPSKGADIQYRLRVPFVDAATRADQRITLSDGKTIDLKLPAGVEDGTQMRLKGKGQAGAGGGGDGLVTISVEPHAFFRREGDNVRLELPITLDEAVNGAKVKVPTVDGAVMLTVSPGSSSGKVLRLKGKGFSTKAGSRGDQLVTLEIDLPGDKADELADLAKRLDGWRDTRNPRNSLGV